MFVRLAKNWRPPCVRPPPPPRARAGGGAHQRPPPWACWCVGEKMPLAPPLAPPLPRPLQAPWGRGVRWGSELWDAALGAKGRVFEGNARAAGELEEAGVPGPGLHAVLGVRVQQAHAVRAKQNPGAVERRGHVLAVVRGAQLAGQRGLPRRGGGQVRQALRVRGARMVRDGDASVVARDGQLHSRKLRRAALQRGAQRAAEAGQLVDGGGGGLRAWRREGGGHWVRIGSGALAHT